MSKTVPVHDPSADIHSGVAQLLSFGSLQKKSDVLRYDFETRALFHISHLKTASSKNSA